MSPRTRRHRGQRRPGLFAWAPDGDIATDTSSNPRTRLCGHCHAAVGHPCTRPGPRGTRIPIRTYHDSRRTQPEDQWSSPS